MSRRTKIKAAGTGATDRIPATAETGLAAAETVGGPATTAPAEEAADPPATFASTRPDAMRLLASAGNLAWPDAPAPVQDDAPAYADPVLALIASEFDRDYYLARYPDIRAAGVDPVEHFARTGWRERRNPASWFDTGYYLASCPDVAAAGLNPFVHYLSSGRIEGRAPRCPARHKRAVLERLRSAAGRTADYAAPDVVSVLVRPHLLAVLRRALVGRGGINLSLSHDCYLRSVGGTQLLIADEQAKFAASGEATLHLSPALPRLVLAPADDQPFYLTLVLDGEELGTAAYDTLCDVLREIGPELPAARRLIVHSVFGHRIDGIVALHRALAARDAVFWLHDYASICVGHTLLRNDIAFCGAPPPDSMACRVCVYGEERRPHLRGIAELFAQISFDVAAPSQAALDLWLRRAGLPHRSARVHGHARFEVTSVRAALAGSAKRGTPGHPVRVGFVGHAVPGKGWPLFADLVERSWPSGAYRFLHFTTERAHPPPVGLETVTVRATPEDRGATVEALASASVDLVAVLSPWPETFCYVAHEAVAAGADVVALADSGNVAAMVLRTGRGVVLPDGEAVLDFFASGRAVEYVRLAHAQGQEAGTLVHEGTTATLDRAEAQ